MSLLKKLEEKIQDLFEGSFNRAFKSPVQPVELARKLVKEMDDHKVVSVSRVYAPNEYTVFLSSADGQQFEAYEEDLKADLTEYLTEHARRENYDLLSRPIVIMETDEDLQVGEFGIATRMVSDPKQSPAAPPPAPEAPAGGPEISRTVIYRPSAQGTMAVSAGEARELGLARECVTLTAVGPEGGTGKVYEVEKRVILIGRSSHADFVLTDANVSRRHAELRRRGGDYAIVDLDSTNGVEVNGLRVGSQPLADGDVITLGATKVTFKRKSC